LLLFFFFFKQYWGLNSGFNACWAGTLSLEPLRQPLNIIFVFGFAEHTHEDSLCCIIIYEHFAE
jgi:hypothetical protein